MDALHELAARVGLAATERFGLALAGGYTVRAHGFLERQSEDVDLFTVADAEDRFDEAVSAAVEAYRVAGLTVVILRQNPAFARLRLNDDQGGQVRVEMGIDWRAHPPVTLEIGAVLHPDDAVANQLAGALRARRRPRLRSVKEGLGRAALTGRHLDPDLPGDPIDGRAVVAPPQRIHIPPLWGEKDRGETGTGTTSLGRYCGIRCV